MDRATSLYNDAYDNYYIVIENALKPEKPQILAEDDGSNTGLNFLRWRQCLQSSERRNRNGRLWPKRYLEIMLRDAIVLECLKHGWPGEAGHPVPDTGKVTVERILTIDPKKISHIVKTIEWEGNKVYGIMETLDDGPSGYGTRFKKNIQQGLDPAVSARTLIPQRRNADGTIDVLGPGRAVCFDRVFVPSHDDAYIDENIPIKDVIKKVDFATAMESFNSEYALDTLFKSEKMKRVTDYMGIAMESAVMNRNGILSLRTDLDGEKSVLFAAPELKYRKDYAGYLRDF